MESKDKLQTNELLNNGNSKIQSPNSEDYNNTKYHKQPHQTSNHLYDNGLYNFENDQNRKNSETNKIIQLESNALYSEQNHMTSKRTANNTKDSNDSTELLENNNSYIKDNLSDRKSLLSYTSNLIPNIEQEEPCSKIIDDIGMSTYQIRILLFGLFIAFSYGSEIVVVSLITRKLEKIWHLSDFKKASLGGSLFYGYLFSALISGKIMSQKGRKFCFTLGSWVFLFFGLFSSMSEEFYSFMFYRIGVGVGLGLVVPSTMTFISEMSPSFLRGFCMNIIWIGYPLGELYICLIAKFFPLDNKFSQDSNWNNTIFYASLPIIINILLLNFVFESPKLLFIKKQFREGFEVLDKMKEADDKEKLSEWEKANIIKFYSAGDKCNDEKRSKHAFDLFEKRYLWLTIQMLVLTLTISYVVFALIYIIPELVGKTAEYVNFHDLLRTVVYATVFETIGLLACFIMEFKSIGRIGAFKISLFICSISSFFCLLDVRNQFSLFVLKGVVGVANRVLFTYFPESYATDIRGEALGMTHSMTKIIGVTCPIICQFLMTYSMFSCFFIISILCVLAFVTVLTLKNETLDQKIE